MTALRLKRAYEPPSADDGTRVLVDRLWPRGMAKDKARVDVWLKDIAPSDALRKRFHGKPDAWDDFRKSYFAELGAEAPQAAAKQLRALLRRGPVTLLFAARNETQNNAVALKMWLERRKRGTA
jgi:uncharacterized protein YeaO (DUF488 family)